MKKEDSMKPLFAEKTDLKQELRIFSFFCFFLLTEITFAQIPLNGFCKLKTYQFFTNFTSFASINFNKDSYSDLLLFKPASKDAILIESFGIGELKEPKNIKLPSQMTKIEPVYNSLNNIEAYAFISRETRTFGIYNFFNSGSASLTLNYSFLSYPTNLGAADINGNGNNEYLISGSAFDGLSILYIKDKKLQEEKIAERTSFSFAHFLDINNDGFTDIAAYNRLNGNLNFYFNNSEGKFDLRRQISLNLIPTQLKSFDLNFDTFNDFVISTGNSIQILFSNFGPSYDSTMIIFTDFRVDDFVIGDFNNDGYFDIVYVSRTEGIISTLFGKNDGHFYKEFVHLKRNGIESIIAFISKFIYGVAYISADGEIGFIASLSSVAEDFDLAVSVEPFSINYIDDDKNGINDLVFIDQFNNTINLLIRNKNGIPAKFYSAKLSGKQNKIIIDDSEGKLKKIFCYSDNSRLIEIVIFNTKTGNIKRDQIYAPGILLDLKLSKSGEERPSIYIVYKKSNKLFSGEFRYVDNNYLLNEFFEVSENFLNVEIIPTEPPLISFWEIKNGNLFLFYQGLNQNNKVEKAKLSLPVSNAEIFSSTFISLDESKYSQIFIINADGKGYISIIKGLGESTLSPQIRLSELRINSKNHLSFIANNDVFLYDETTSVLWRAELSANQKNIRFKEEIKAFNIKDFIVVNLDFRNNHLIYNNKKNGSISVRRLK
jgi:hypothetical protein